MTGRYGGLWGGRKKLLTDFFTSRSESAVQADPAITPTDFDYTSSKGIWNLKSTSQFKKASNIVVASGLTSELIRIKGANNAWTQRTINISQYANKSARVVFRYINRDSGELGDLQLDLISVSGTTYSFENVSESFQTNTTNNSRYSTITWSTIAASTTGGRWNFDTGGTPTVGTSRTDAAGGTYYVYAETSGNGAADEYNFWLRSPIVSLGASPTLSFYEARNGSTIGELFVYLDIQ